MKNTILLYILILSSNLSLAQEIQQSQINGLIKDVTEDKIQIGSQTIPVADNGEFIFTKTIETPTLLDVSYADLEWSIFIKPESIINLLIKDKSLKHIEYSGDLVSSNTYLLKVDSISKNVNSFLNKNWVSLHSQNQADYLSNIDSLKGLYLKHLENYLKTNEIYSADYIEIWNAEINYGFNSLIIKYPVRHFQYTQKKAELNSQSIDYLKLSNIDDFKYFELPNYKRYTKAWIDYQTELLAEKNTSSIHYSLKKMNAVFEIIPEMFSDRYLTDYWLAEYLKEHIQENGIVNSKQYSIPFFESCKTEKIKNEIEKYVASEMEIRNDHDIFIYKTENTFNLEAHIFRPKDISIDKKRSAIVIFHGGGWSSGSPTWAFKDAKHYAELGMIGISGHYRLSNRRDVTPVEAMQDAKDLIIWLRMNADSLGIDKDRIAAAGWSAGAHLAASTAIFADTLTKEKINSMPNALLLNSPAVDLANESWFNKMLNNRPVNPTSLSPLESVFKGLPPTILLQGRDDTVTPLKGTQSFHDKMIEYGNYCELWIYDNVGHLFTPSNLNDRGQPRPDKEIQKKAEKKADNFLMKIGYLK